MQLLENKDGVVAGAVVDLNFGRLAVARLHGRGELLREPSSGFILDTTPGQPLAMHPLLVADRTTLPIAVVNAFEYLYLVHYAPEWRARLYFVAASPTDFTYAAFPRFFRCCAPISNEPVLAGEFAREHPEYLVYGDGRTPEQIAALATPGSRVESIVIRDEHFLARMSGTSIAR